MATDPIFTIQLDQFLKFLGAAATGGQAKMLIRQGQVRVNGEQELRPGRKLKSADVVQLDGESFTVEFDEE